MTQLIQFFSLIELFVSLCSGVKEIDERTR